MKIIQINSVFGNGSTGKIVYDIHTTLKKRKIESIVCYGRGSKINEQNVYKICSENESFINHFFNDLSGILYSGYLLSTHRLISIINQEKPDVVHIHCLNGYFVNIYKLLRWLKDNDIKTVITLHAEFMYTGGCGHAFDCEKWKNGEKCINCKIKNTKLKPILRNSPYRVFNKLSKSFHGFKKGNLVIASVSPWLMQRAMNSSMLKEYFHTTIINGLNASIFRPYDVSETESIKKKYGIENKKIILHVTPDFDNDIGNIKGGYYVIELAKKLEKENVVFLVAGPYKQNICVPSNIILLGKIYNQELLARYYSMADVTLITSKRETFSMVVAESLCSGTPVVGFNAGAPEMITIPEYSKFSQYGNIDCLLKNVYYYMQSNVNKKEVAKKGFEKYNYMNMVEKYLKIYRLLLEEKNERKI